MVNWCGNSCRLKFVFFFCHHVLPICCLKIENPVLCVHEWVSVKFIFSHRRRFIRSFRSLILPWSLPCVHNAITSWVVSSTDTSVPPICSLLKRSLCFSIDFCKVYMPSRDSTTGFWHNKGLLGKDAHSWPFSSSRWEWAFNLSIATNTKFVVVRWLSQQTKIKL